MKQTQATRRLGEQLREKLGYILIFEIADPRLDLVTLTGVDVAVDRSYARVFVTCDGDRYDEVLEALDSAKGTSAACSHVRLTGASRPLSISGSIAPPTRRSASPAPSRTFLPRFRSRRTRRVTL